MVFVNRCFFGLPSRAQTKTGDPAPFRLATSRAQKVSGDPAPFRLATLPKRKRDRFAEPHRHNEKGGNFRPNGIQNPQGHSACGCKGFVFFCPCVYRVPFPPALACTRFRFAIPLLQVNASLCRCFLHLRFNDSLFRQNGMAVGFSLGMGLPVVGISLGHGDDELVDPRE